MQRPSMHARPQTSVVLRSLAAFVLVTLAACSAKPPPPTPDPVEVPAVVVPMEPPPTPKRPPIADKKVSQAKTAREYRKDAASHLYALNQSRVFQGKMPPLLHAVGVLQVEIDPRGAVSGISWMRAPRHAPDVMAEIEKSVRRAAPFPVPVRLGKVIYTDTWLWHSSGQFQLDTLTEGQL